MSDGSVKLLVSDLIPKQKLNLHRKDAENAEVHKLLLPEGAAPGRQEYCFALRSLRALRLPR